MIKIAFNGTDWIGKSTTVSNVAVALAEKGLKVMQIGCDPKADSTIALRHGEAVPTVLDLFREKKQDLKLEDMVRFLIPNYIKEGKNRLVIAIGCTGGKHRSVTLTNALYERLKKNQKYGLRVEHRDIDKDAKRGK